VADEEVITTRCTVGAIALMEDKIPVVPCTAGSIKSFTGSVTLKWYGDAVWMTTSRCGMDLRACYFFFFFQFPIKLVKPLIGPIERSRERVYRMSNLIVCPILGDIFHNHVRQRVLGLWKRL
jgi:hypothetical protein